MERLGMLQTKGTLNFTQILVFLLKLQVKMDVVQQIFSTLIILAKDITFLDLQLIQPRPCLLELL